MGFYRWYLFLKILTNYFTEEWKMIFFGNFTFFLVKIVSKDLFKLEIHNVNEKPNQKIPNYS